jgi:hypothetical protein
MIDNRVNIFIFFIDNYFKGSKKNWVDHLFFFSELDVFINVCVTCFWG